MGLVASRHVLSSSMATCQKGNFTVMHVYTLFDWRIVNLFDPRKWVCAPSVLFLSLVGIAPLETGPKLILPWHLVSAVS